MRWNIGCFFRGDEDTMLEATATYYYGKSIVWRVEYSLLLYLDMVEQYLMHEEEVVAQCYLYPLIRYFFFN